VDPPSLLSSGVVWFSPKGKANGHEAEFSSPSNYKVKNTWTLAINSSIFSMVVYLIRTRMESNFTAKNRLHLMKETTARTA